MSLGDDEGGSADKGWAMGDGRWAMEKGKMGRWEDGEGGGSKSGEVERWVEEEVNMALELGEAPTSSELNGGPRPPAAGSPLLGDDAAMCSAG